MFFEAIVIGDVVVMINDSFVLFTVSDFTVFGSCVLETKVDFRFEPGVVVSKACVVESNSVVIGAFVVFSASVIDS